MNRLAVKRFLKYSTIGFLTFSLDLFLLFLLTDIFAWNYLVATGVAFIIAISINYAVSRSVVFKFSKRTVTAGYVRFVIVAGIGLCLVVAGMYVMTELLAVNYIISRILIAGVVGMWNYLLNLHFNFKVAGLH